MSGKTVHADGGDAAHSAEHAKAGAGGGLRGLLRRKVVIAGIGILGGVGLLVTVALLFLRSPELPPEEQLKQALAHLDSQNDGEARTIATKLQEQGYQDAEFAGGIPFILGMTSFRESRTLEGPERDRGLLLAANSLREAERMSIPAERRPEWSYATGTCLYASGMADEAFPLLEEALRTYPPGRAEAGLAATQILIDGRTTRELEQALAINTELVEDATLSSEDREHAWLHRAEILLGLERRQEAEAALGHVPQDSSRRQGIVILRAQAAMAEGRLREAIQILEPLARDWGLEKEYPSQASYLTGVCLERLGEFENAIGFYERTAERSDPSQEALASRLGAAAAFRKLGRNEESLEAYGQVLRAVRRPRSFHNRWVSLKQLQEAVFEAWNSWTEHRFFNEAITLAEMMSPAVARDQSLELVARAHERWARHTELEVESLPLDRQTARRPEVEFRWQQSGHAYARLAENRQASADYLHALWTSAEHFFQGRDFTNAIARLGLFIESRSSSLLPAALVRRGQCQMSLSQWDLALRDFQEVIAFNPSDPAAFQARYLIGQCHMERNEPEQAERIWRGILEAGELTPTALEWRRALYSLGKLLYDTAEIRRRKVVSGTDPKVHLTPEGLTELAGAASRFDEAVLRLEEFRDRYPSADEALEVRFLRARALQKSAEFPQAKFLAAETDNARSEYRRQMHERLDQALGEFQQLQTLLLTRQSNSHLERQGQVMLRNCFFEIANCHFLRERYEEAIVAYSSSAGRYQNEPDSLTAYVQIANCFDRLQKPAEAMSTLAQAQLILKQLPDSSFTGAPGTMSRDDWQRWLDWAMRLHQ
jgi:tetratricopeptide (TPR) repeat protein